MFIRCVTCGKVFRRALYEAIQTALTDEDRLAIFLNHRIIRMCCRRHYLTDVDTEKVELNY